MKYSRYYQAFLDLHPGIDPESWEARRTFVIWLDAKHKEFRKMNGIERWRSYGPQLVEEFIVYIRNDSKVEGGAI